MADNNGTDNSTTNDDNANDDNANVGATNGVISTPGSEVVAASPNATLAYPASAPETAPDGFASAGSTPTVEQAPASSTPPTATAAPAAPAPVLPAARTGKVQRRLTIATLSLASLIVLAGIFGSGVLLGAHLGTGGQASQGQMQGGPGGGFGPGGSGTDSGTGTGPGTGTQESN
jgi:hypothetical protein